MEKLGIGLQMAKGVRPRLQPVYWQVCVCVVVCNLMLCICMGTCVFDSWRGPTRTLTAGCTRAGTVETSSMRGSPTGPAGTRCPKVSKSQNIARTATTWIRKRACIYSSSDWSLTRRISPFFPFLPAADGWYFQMRGPVIGGASHLKPKPKSQQTELSVGDQIESMTLTYNSLGAGGHIGC